MDVSSFVEDSVASFSAAAETAGVKLSASVSDGLPPIDVDPVRMRSVIGNVIANALTHTPADGSVSLNAARKGDQIAITVTDTGEGIAPELLARVFDRFVKGEESKGSGLGLAIAHDIVAAHGGSISIESTVGTGTTVRMTLPIAE